MTFDEKLAIALDESANEQLERYSSGKSPNFSLSYKIWRVRVIKQAAGSSRSGRCTVKRVRLMILAIILASCAVTGITAYGLGISMGRYRIEFAPRWRSTLRVDSADTDRTVIEQYYGMSKQTAYSLRIILFSITQVFCCTLMTISILNFTNIR